MAAKKERGRFSLRFNISDPIHLATVELLEKQPDHGKAQYIANAVVFYDTHFADDPQPLRAAAPAPQERTPEPEYAPELGEAVEADDAILGLISSTMEAFRQGR